MNTLVHEFYQMKEQKGETPSFHAILFLADGKEEWEEVNQKSAGLLPRGWFELCQLAVEDRLAFTRDFWLDRLPYHPHAHESLGSFFEQLDDVGVVLSQLNQGDPWIPEMVYSLKENRCFFRGRPPAFETEIEEMSLALRVNLPRDYLAFLHIHNGFGKLSELGLLRIEEVIDAKRRLTEELMQIEQTLKLNGQIIDPGALIPFFEYVGLASYQCFFSDWYPGNEMGNVYLSGIDYTISDYMDRKGWVDQCAFPTFQEWLAFYLEGNNLD